MSMETYKICPRCKVKKELVFFYKRPISARYKLGVRTNCKDCERVEKQSKNGPEERRKHANRARLWRIKNPNSFKTSNKKYVEKNKEKVRERMRDWNIKNSEWLRNYQMKYRKQNKEKHAEYNLKKKYGMSFEDYDSLGEKQLWSCAICKTHVSKLDRDLFVDHCHKSQMVRGLLCRCCNLLLGYAKDDIKVLKETIKYLKTYAN